MGNQFVPVSPGGLDQSAVDARVAALAERRPLDAGAITPNATLQTLATTEGQDKHWTLATGSSITSPLAFSGDGEGIIRVTQLDGGLITLPTAALLGDTALPTGDATFDLYITYNVASEDHAYYVGNLTAIPA